MACEDIQAKLNSLKQQKLQTQADLKELGQDVNPIIRARFNQELAQTDIAISAAEKELQDCLNLSPPPIPLSPIVQSEHILTTNFNNPSFDTSDPNWASHLVGGKTYPEDYAYEWVQVLKPYRQPITRIIDNAGVPAIEVIDPGVTYPSADLDADLVGLSGWAIHPELSDRDLPFSHPFGNDWEFYVAPDSQYASLLGASNKASDDSSYETARQDAASLGLTVPGVLGVEMEQGLIPEPYRAREGDRVAVFGRWIVDAGHNDFHTEVHPPLLLVTARVAPKPNASVVSLVPIGITKPRFMTETTIISRPYLVGQEYEDDNAPFYQHIKNEIEKVEEIFGSTQLEAHPKVPPKPFSGVHLISYTIKPPTPPQTPQDHLTVSFHFTVRSGVTVQVIGDSASVTVFVAMNEVTYVAAPRPPKHDRTLSLEELSRMNQSVDTAVDWLDALNAIFDQYALIIENAGGVLTDLYDPPQPTSVHDAEITKLRVSELTENTPFSVDDSQPFPIYGFLNLEWEPSQPQKTSIG